MLCTYEHDIYSRYSDLQCEEAVQYHESNIRDLKKYFDDHNNHTLKKRIECNIIFISYKRKKRTCEKIT